LNQIFSNVDAYIRNVWNQLNVEKSTAVCTYSPTINRDSKCDNVDSIISNDVYLETDLIGEITPEVIKSHCLKIMEIIRTVNQGQFSSKPLSVQYDKQDIDIMTMTKLIKTYPTLPIYQAIEQHIINHGPCIIMGIFRAFEEKERFNEGLPASDDYDLCSILFVYDEMINRVLPIMKISPKPNFEKIKKQLVGGVSNI
jgi:hypothetical protein